MAKSRKRCAGCLPDELWERMQPWLPRYQKSARGGRPRSDLRKVANGIFYVLRTGCQWKAAPREFASGSTLHRYFQQGVAADVFRRLWKAALLEYDELKGIEWNWQSVDGAMTKSPLGGEKTGKNPTDRGKLGVKRSVLTDGRGIPLGVEVSGANTHDIKLLQATFDSIPIKRPQPTSRKKQHVCLDKGYDSKDVRKFLRRRHYQPHVKSRGQEETERKKNPRFKARRWVVERTHSWINRFRRLLVRWEKKADNYLAFLQFSFAWSTLSSADVLG